MVIVAWGLESIEIEGDTSEIIALASLRLWDFISRQKDISFEWERVEKFGEIVDGSMGTLTLEDIVYGLFIGGDEGHWSVGAFARSAADDSIGSSSSGRSLVRFPVTS